MILILALQFVFNAFYPLRYVLQEVVSEYTNQEYESFETKVEDVIGKLNTYYYEDIDEELLYEEAIRGYEEAIREMVDSVGDPYTTYLQRKSMPHLWKPWKAVMTESVLLFLWGDRR